MRFFSSAALAGCAVVSSSPAYAWDTPETRSAEIKTERVGLTLNNGEEAIATIRYIIAVTYNINEEGSPTGIYDSRTCRLASVSRVLTRTMILKSRSYAGKDIGGSFSMLAAPPEVKFTSNCNIHYFDKPADIAGAFNRAMGTSSEWQSEIEADKRDAMSTLALLGRLAQTQ
jgi:hypothetical protein